MKVEEGFENARNWMSVGIQSINYLNVTFIIIAPILQVQIIKFLKKTGKSTAPN